MDARHRTNVEVDRLSSLPDDLIHKILSFIGLKNAIKTSSLSSRWRFIWTSMPYLDFSILDFSTFTKFSDYVTHVLSRRNNIVHVFSVKLRFSGDYNEECFKQIMNYAFSHNIQQLDVACLLENYIEFPLSLFNSQSLKHLSLTREFDFRSCDILTIIRALTTTSTWQLPALTTLYLDHITLCCYDENTDTHFPLFSKCANLKNLSLRSCTTKGVDSLIICNPQLINLTVENHNGGWKVFNVVTPKLKNLTIRDPSWEHCIISAPELISLHYNRCHSLHLSTDGFNSLENVDLCVSGQNYKDALGIVSLFHDIKSVKFLKLNLEIVELLSSQVEIIFDHPSPFTNLKMLKIYPANVDLEKEEQKKVKMSMKVRNYLLNGSPSATFTMVSREEIIAMRNTELAQNLMTKLRVLLDEERVKVETNMAHTDQGDAQVQSQLQIEGRMTTRINMCWKDLSVQIEQGREKTCKIFLKLQNIKKILKKLPASKRADMQACFSSLCAEADTLVKKIIEHMKIQCDRKGSHFGVCFHELASTSDQ